MKRALIIILSVFIVSNSLTFNKICTARAYNFEADSGLMSTGYETGHFELSETVPISLPERIGKWIKAVLSFLGVAFLLLMIYSGYIWMMARGNEQEVEKAKSIIKNALIGLIVVLAAYTITWTIFSNILYKMSQ